MSKDYRFGFSLTLIPDNLSEGPESLQIYSDPILAILLISVL